MTNQREIITIHLTKRERYCKAINHLWANPEKYKVHCRGRYMGLNLWYIEFERI